MALQSRLCNLGQVLQPKQIPTGGWGQVDAKPRDRLSRVGFRYEIEQQTRYFSRFEFAALNLFLKH